MIVVDTTILVYAVGGEHPLASPCRELVRRVAAGDVRATTTVEVIQEFAHVRARRRSRTDATELARSFATLLEPLLVVRTEDLAAGLDAFAQHDALGAFDAVLAATSVRAGARGIASADRAFENIPGLVHIDPAHPAFGSHLER
jgi:predicted nucleic acid-binding protein